MPKPLCDSDTNHYDDWVADIFTNKSSDIYTGENALTIAWGTLLENVTGGPPSNRITDNAVSNDLTGGAGDDLFYLGAGGFDTVVGGGGYDLVVLDQYTLDEPVDLLPFAPISSLYENNNPRNINYMPVVVFFVCLDLEPKS